MIVATEAITRWKGESIVRGTALVMVALSTYSMNLFIFYWLTTDLPVVQVIGSMLGFAIAFGYDRMGCHIPVGS